MDTKSICELCGHSGARNINGVDTCMQHVSEQEWNDAAPLDSYEGVLRLEGAIEFVAYQMPVDEQNHGPHYGALETLRAALGRAILANAL